MLEIGSKIEIHIANQVGGRFAPGRLERQPHAPLFEANVFN